jgi:multiple sugar transport system permease protein
MISKNYRLQQHLQKTLRLIVIICAVVIILFPIYWFALISLKTQKEAFSSTLKIFFTPTFVHYQKLFTSNIAFGRYYLNSMSVSLFSTLFALFFGVMTAYALSRTKLKGKNKILLAILGARMVPPILFIIPYYVAFTKLGLIDTRIGLIVIFLQFNLTMVVWTMRAFFDDIPRDMEESAVVDGAGDFTVFLKIVLPLTAPGIAATTVLCLMMSWNEFVYPLLLTQLKAMTAPVAVVVFSSHEAADWGMVAAGSILLTLPVLLFVIMVKKYLVKGMLGGALKG